MTGVTWLHLSDWHQENEKFKFNRKVVCDGLIKDIKAREQEISPRLKKIDFIVFSGDVAKGGDTDEYKKAQDEFFTPILDACKLGPERLFIIPGNHDLNRDQIPVSLSKPLTSNEEVERCWSEKRKTALLPFQDFYHSFPDLTGRETGEHCDFGPIEVGGKKISLLCINSAWMCARHKDEGGEVSDQGYLCVGEPQIYESLEKISGSDIRIALLHHPFDWLAPFDKSRMDVHLKRKCNFILHGHAHEPGVSAIKDNFGYHITIPAGACYDRSLPSSSDYTYSYNYVHLDFDSDKGIVFFRKWSELNRSWKKDDETAPPNGERDFSISGSNKPPIPHQIPPPPRDFKGREQDISDILSSFEKGAAITGVRGMGGVGKTALALKLAERIKDNFPDGQIFIDMRGTSTNPNLPALKPEEAMAHVIRAYNPVDRLPENTSELRGLYLSVLAGKRALLLLDNASNADQVETLLPPAGCSVIITSRLRFALPGLAEKDLDILPALEARQLLLEIAPRIGDRADELAKLCGYLPLALRNAASALAEKKSLKVSEYEQHLEDKLGRLELVEGSFSLSYDLLTSGRRKQWSRLSIFPEDFDHNAATAVLEMTPRLSAEALSDLVQWSLVDYIPTVDSEDGRYKLHDLSRIFAESRLNQNELANAQRKHAIYYLKTLSRANNLYKKGGASLLEGLNIFDQEWANIRIGQAWVKGMFESYRMLKKTDSRFAMQMSSSFAINGIFILALRLNPDELVKWLKTGLNAAKISGDLRAEEIHLGNLGNAYSNLNETRMAIDCHLQALDISRKIGHKKDEGNHLGSLGLDYEALGETSKAIMHYEQALSIAREIGDIRGEGNRLGNLGNSYANLGDTRKAIEYYERALHISQMNEDLTSEGIDLGNLGKMYGILGETQKAIEHFERALTIARKIGDKRSEGRHQSNLSKLYCSIGDLQKALEHCDQALKIFQEIEYPIGEADALFAKSQALHQLGQHEEAISCAQQALAIFQRIESPLAEKVRQQLAEWGSPQET